MRYLFLFIDMLRPNLLNICNSTLIETPLDKTLKSLGGTVFTNCFTPAPDTARSSACLWSSKYPKSNGCNTRMRWPQYFYKEPENSALYLLKKAGYSFNLFVNNPRIHTELLPPYFDDERLLFYERTLTEWIKYIKNNNKIEDNSVTMVYLPDFHILLDGFGYNLKSVNKANKFVDELVKSIFSSLDIHLFDYTFIFSDHGFFLEDEKKLFPLLSVNRIQIFLQVIRKSDDDIVHNPKLCSIMDIYPTLLNSADVDYLSDIEGINLFSCDAHEYLLEEDHSDFSINIGMCPKTWGVVDLEGIHRIGVDGTWISSSTNEEKLVFYKKELESKMSYFLDFQKENEVLNDYKIVRNHFTCSNGVSTLMKKPLVYYFLRLIKYLLPYYFFRKRSL